MSAIDKCTIIEFPKIVDTRGNLTFIENNRHIPFTVRRIYYLYDVPGGAQRGGHAHRELEQVIIALSGSFMVTLDDGSTKRRHHLHLPNFGIYVCQMVWREIVEFSSNSVCLVLASSFYNESEYLRDYDEFCRIARGEG